MADQTTQSPLQDENHIIAERREKLAQWRLEGHAYPNDFTRENTAGKLDELYGNKEGEALEAAPVEVKVAGRIMLKRIMGKASGGKSRYQRRPTSPTLAPWYVLCRGSEIMKISFVAALVLGLAVSTPISACAASRTKRQTRVILTTGLAAIGIKNPLK
ncbi:hypothetical protein FACS189488_14790 [Betaproteobacteria bacterium]|nr:hypothetical protein FACS189488_14790 [Betaproteobacteria bacterium]